jgi:hypothetical protein
VAAGHLLFIALPISESILKKDTGQRNFCKFQVSFYARRAPRGLSGVGFGSDVLPLAKLSRNK